MTATKFPSKWLIVGAMMVFLGTSFLIIELNSRIFNYGFHMDFTISHYVGLEVWSSLAFVLSNIFVAIFLGRFLWQLGLAWRMPKVYYILVLIVAAMLIGLSMCPSGMFDAGGVFGGEIVGTGGTISNAETLGSGGEKLSIITLLHIFTSRAMFFAMMLVAAMIVICRHANPLAHLFSVGYLIYAVFCIVGFVSAAPWFDQYVLIFETLYLFGFMFMLILCDKSTINRINQINQQLGGKSSFPV